MKECGNCSLCCSLLEVKALNKPKNAACQYGGCDGCEIFGRSERPQACSDYKCAWLFNAAWADSLRPDRCGIVFEPFGDLNFTANVDPERPDSWRIGAGRVVIDRMLSYKCMVIVVVGDIKHVLLPPGKTPLDAWKAFDSALREKDGRAFLHN